MSSLFDNCTRHSRLEHHYLNCTNTTNQCDLIQNCETIIEIMSWVNLGIPSALFILAFILNAYFLSILVPLFLKMNDSTRKQYVFVVSRCVSSMSAAIAMLILCILQFYSYSFSFYLFIYFVDDLSFYSLLSSYVSSAVLLYLATVRPVYYSLRISVFSVYKFAAANWIASIFLAITSAIFQAATASEGPFECDAKHCQPILNIVMFTVICVSFIVPICILLFVLVTLHCYKSRAESIGAFTTSSPTFRSARTRLAWTLFTFTLISMGEAIPSSFLVGVDVGDSVYSCTIFYQADHMRFLAAMASFQTLAWSIALVVDPLCGLLFDPRIRKVRVANRPSPECASEDVPSGRLFAGKLTRSGRLSTYLQYFPGHNITISTLFPS